VDAAVEACSKLVNVRQAILDSRNKFDQYVATDNNQVTTSAAFILSPSLTCTHHRLSYIVHLLFVYASL